jgi:RNA polymerase sigma-70 factor (ECF subfamily)
MRELDTEARAEFVETSAEAGLTQTGRSGIDIERMNDEELLLEYRLTGNSAVFEALVKRYERELYNYLRRFLNNQALAEDAFQATFLQVHLKCHLFDGERKVRPWLYTVATNQAIDIQRRNRRHRLVSLDRPNRIEHDKVGSLVEVLSGRDGEPDSGLEQGERREWIRQAVAALPEQLRAAVRLVYFRGLKYREAADELDVPVGTVKSRLHSAIKRLGEAWHNAQPTERN